MQTWIKLGGPKFKKLGYCTALMEFNCSEKKFRLLVDNSYSQGGRVIEENTFQYDSSDSSSWILIVPETPTNYVEGLFNIVCTP